MVALMLMTFGALLAFRDQDFATELDKTWEYSMAAPSVSEHPGSHLEHPKEEMQCSLPLTSFS